MTTAYSKIKKLGEGAFGEVWKVNWDGPPNYGNVGWLVSLGGLQN